MVRRLGVAGVSSPLQWSPGQTVRSIEGRGYTFLGGGHPALCHPSHMPWTTIAPCHLPPPPFVALLSRNFLPILSSNVYEASLSANFFSVSQDRSTFFKEVSFFILVTLFVASRVPRQDSLSFLNVASNVLSRRRNAALSRRRE